MEKEIGRIQKGEYQGTKTDIVIGVKEYNGRVGIDIREFTQSETYSGPTKKGLRIPAESFEKFKEMINSIDSNDLKSSNPTQEKLPQKPTPQPSQTEDEEMDAGLDADGLM